MACRASHAIYNVEYHNIRQKFTTMVKLNTGVNENGNDTMGVDYLVFRPLTECNNECAMSTAVQQNPIAQMDTS